MSFPTHSKAGKGGGGSDRYWLGIHPIEESFWWEDLWVFGAGVYQARGPQEWWGVRGGGEERGRERERSLTSVPPPEQGRAPAQQKHRPGLAF